MSAAVASPPQPPIAGEPSHQHMVRSPTPSLRRSSSADGGDASDASYTTSSSPAPSPNRLLELQRSPRSEEYRQLFRLPPEEVLVQDFNCALQENFLLQGHMYLFGHNICFYSNLFGFETKKIIPFQEVTSVKRAKTAAIFPNAIELVAGGKKYFFTSFLSRDEAFKLINDGWLEYGKEDKACSDQGDQQELPSELSSQEPGIVIVESPNAIEQPVDELGVSPSIKVDSGPQDSVTSPSGGPEISTTPSAQNDEDDDTVIVSNTECLSSGSTLVPEMDTCDAPGVPECFTLAAESKFPIKVADFFRLFFSDDAFEFLELYHKKCGDKDLKSTSWKPQDKFCYTREVSFQHPIKIYFGARFGSCKEIQKYHVYKNSHLVLNTSQEINDVPYGDYFSVEGIWDVEPDGDESSQCCKLRVYVDVAFSKKTIWKGKIVQATTEECRDTFATFIELAHNLLKKKSIEKEAPGSHPAKLIPGGELQVEQEGSESLESLQEGGLSTSTIVPDTASNDHNQISMQSQGSSMHAAAVLSFCRDSVAPMFSSVKSWSQVSSPVVIILAVIILLMQVSIIFLLLRPQQVQVIHGSDMLSNMNSERRADMIALVGKQINHLKDEMVVVERLLEKMRHEHDLLTKQLKNIAFLGE